MSIWLGFLTSFETPKRVSEIEHFITVPLVRQPNGHTCGCAAVLCILGYYGKDYDYEELTKELKATDKNGVDHRDIIKFFESNGFDVELHKGMLMSDLFQFIDDGFPIIVCFQAYGEDPSKYGGYGSGHYSVVCGYNENNIYFMDPSTLGNYTYITIDEFSRRWHDEDAGIKLRQAGIVVKKEKKYDPDSIKKLR